MFKVLEFTYPPGSHHIPRTEWATRATLKLTDLPSSFSICSSVFVKSWVLTATDCNVKFFQILTEDGNRWSFFRVGPDLSGTGRVFMLFHGRSQDRVRIVTNATPPKFFPRFWVRACVTFDAAAGAVRIVADGQVVADASHPQLMSLAETMPRNLTLKVGGGSSINSLYSDLNVFSEPLSLEKMAAITSPGGTECGSRGDILNWDEAKWTLSDKWADGQWADWVLVVNASKVEEIEWIRGPCWRPSRIKVYPMYTLHDHSNCMKHCGKIGHGRSPSLVTQEDWRWLAKELEPITNKIYSLNAPNTLQDLFLWLAATEGNSGEALTMV